MAAEHYRVREERLAELERVPETQERRATGEAPQPQGNGVLRKWLLGLASAAILLGVGGLVAWGAQGAEVAQNTEAIKEVRAVQLEDGRAMSGIKARQDMMLERLGELQGDIKKLLRRGHR